LAGATIVSRISKEARILRLLLSLVLRKRTLSIGLNRHTFVEVNVCRLDIGGNVKPEKVSRGLILVIALASGPRCLVPAAVLLSC
jgi:hypothetical protein